MVDRIPELLTHRHLLDLSKTCLYMVHFNLSQFFWKTKKTCVYYKNKPKYVSSMENLFGFNIQLVFRDWECPKDCKYKIVVFNKICYKN